MIFFCIFRPKVCHFWKFTGKIRKNSDWANPVFNNYHFQIKISTCHQKSLIFLTKYFEKSTWRFAVYLRHIYWNEELENVCRSFSFDPPWRCQAGEGIFFGIFKVFPIAFPDHCFTKKDAPESHLGVTSVKSFKNQTSICDSWSIEFELKNGYLEIYTPKRYEIFLLKANASYPYKWSLIWCFFVSKLISCNLHTIELYT